MSSNGQLNVDVVCEVPVARTARLMQLEGQFDLPVTETSRFVLKATLPLHQHKWQVGLITGSSGSGKSTLARQLWPNNLTTGYSWSKDKSVVDDFRKDLSIREITAALSSVGFSSPPAWQRPYRVLSNGEKFRANLARCLAEGKDLVVFDEFTSVVSRGVAKIASAALSKSVRRTPSKQFVAVTCHDDVVDWLDPDWVYNTDSRQFAWRSLQGRPSIEVTIQRCERSLWQTFRRHHYLDDSLSALSTCWVGLVDDRPVAFTAVCWQTHQTSSGYREHRTVCLPDYQGVGIGNAMSEFVAGMYVCTGKPYRSVTSHPAMILHRARSSDWNMTRKPSFVPVMGGRNMGGLRSRGKNLMMVVRRLDMRDKGSHRRMTATFEYVGQPRIDEAKLFGLI